MGTIKNLTTGIPFDMIGYLAAAEETRQRLEEREGVPGTVVWTIGDEDVTANEYAASKQDAVRHWTDLQRSMLGRIVDHYERQDFYRIMGSSELAGEPLYDSLAERFAQADGLFSRFDESTRRYNAYQLADEGSWPGVEDRQIFVNKRGELMFHPDAVSTLKLSWKIPDPKRPRPPTDPLHPEDDRRDELFFDANARAAGLPLAFVTTYCGKSPDPDRPDVCPYTSSARETNRILLTDSLEAIERKVRWYEDPASPTAAWRVRQHLGEIVAAFESIVGPAFAGTDTGHVVRRVKKTEESARYSTEGLIARIFTINQIATGALTE